MRWAADSVSVSTASDQRQRGQSGLCQMYRATIEPTIRIRIRYEYTRHSYHSRADQRFGRTAAAKDRRELSRGRPPADHEFFLLRVAFGNGQGQVRQRPHEIASFAGFQDQQPRPQALSSEPTGSRIKSQIGLKVLKLLKKLVPGRGPKVHTGRPPKRRPCYPPSQGLETRHSGRRPVAHRVGIALPNSTAAV